MYKSTINVLFCSVKLGLDLNSDVRLGVTDHFNNPFPNKSLFLRDHSSRLLKTLWEKEKLLLTSNFSFFYCVFYPSGEFSTVFITF